MDVRKTRQRLVALEVLALLGESHGFEIASKAGLKLGTVYGVLMGFEQDGVVSSAWEEDAPAGRPRRRLYRLTERGHELLDEYRAHFGPKVERSWLAAVSQELHTAIDEVWGGMFRAGSRREMELQKAAEAERERIRGRRT
jgi:DNA-binding PadR family transcriptional regulator